MSPLSASLPLWLCRHLQGVGDGSTAPLDDLPLTGRLVGAANLVRLLPNARDLLHRKEARQLDVLYGAS